MGRVNTGRSKVWSAVELGRLPEDPKKAAKGFEPTSPVPDDRLAAVFEPDTMLATQYFDRLRRRVNDGSRRLMVAVLEDAVNVYLKRNRFPNRPRDLVHRLFLGRG